MSYGNRISFVVASYSAMKSEFAEKIDRTRSPTSSMIVVEVELLRQCLADLVDDGELGVALVRLGQQALRLVEEARALERDGHARGERAQEPLICLVVRIGARRPPGR